MKIFLASPGVSALVALAPVATSTHFCNGNNTTIHIGTGPGGVNVAYVAVDEVFGEWWSYWVYAETNGVTGLQRGGVTLAGDADICQDYSVGHDQGVF